MSHPKNKVMERMTLLERWNGLAWVCTAWLWKGLGRCRGGGVQEPQCSPKHNAFDSSGCLCLGVTQSLPFLPQVNPRTSHGKHRLRERTNRRLLRQPSKKHSKPMFRATFLTCSRTPQGMDTDGLEELGFSQKKSPKKPINRVCPREESTDEQSETSTTGQRQMGPPATPERLGVNVKSTWSGCEVKQVGDLSLFAIPLPTWFTHASLYGHRRRQRGSSVVVIHPEVCQTKPLL